MSMLGIAALVVGWMIGGLTLFRFMVMAIISAAWAGADYVMHQDVAGDLASQPDLFMSAAFLFINITVPFAIGAVLKSSNRI